MKRKAAVITLVSLLTVSISGLFGCSNASPDKGNASSEGTVSSEGSASTEKETACEESASGESVASVDENKEITEVFWQYPAYGEISEGFQDMEDALNEMMERDIGVHVTFVTTDLMTSQNDATLMISAGEQLDICLSFFQSLGNLVNKGLIYNLDDLLVSSGTKEIYESKGIYPEESCTYNGKTYGVPTHNIYYQTYSYLMKKNFAEKYGFEADDNKIYTVDEIEKMFETVKAGEGDDFLCYVPWNTTYEPLNYGLCEYDKLGGDMSLGVLMLNKSFENTTIENIFETDEYADFCDRMYDWAQKGYISADAAITADAADDICARENVLGTFGYGAPELDMLEGNGWNVGVVQFKVVDTYIPNTNCSCTWSIPITSGNPEKALQAVTYIVEHPEAAWLIQYGIEGESWVITERDGDRVGGNYASEDTNELPYLNVYGLWGNRLETVPFAGQPLDYNDKRQAAQDACYANNRVTPSSGYVFVTDSVSADIAAVQTVIAQYATSLNCGALDPAQALPDFISALKAAGIDTIIQENQKQFDEFLASK